MMNIYVGNFSFDATDDDLQKLFEGFGAVESVKIITAKYSGRSKGFGFVKMETKADAERAIQELNGKEFMERALRVNEARPQENQTEAEEEQVADKKDRDEKPEKHISVRSSRSGRLFTPGDSSSLDIIKTVVDNIDPIKECIKWAFTAGVLKLGVDVVKAVIDAGKAKKVKIKKGDFEVEFQGKLSDKEIENRVAQIMSIRGDFESNDIKIILSGEQKRRRPKKRGR